MFTLAKIKKKAESAKLSAELFTGLKFCTTADFVEGTFARQ